MHRRAFLATALAGVAGGCAVGSRGGDDRSAPAGTLAPPGSGPFFDAGGTIRALLAPSPDRLYVLTEAEVRAVSGAGEQQWAYGWDGLISRPVVLEETVYVATNRSELPFHPAAKTMEAIEEGTGDRLWRADPLTSPFGLLAGDDGAIYAGTRDDAGGATGETVFALDAADGEERWSVESGDASTGHLRDDLLFVPTSGRVYAYDVGTGDERWRASYDPGPGGTWPLDDRLLVADDGLHALDPEDGDVNWSFTGEGFPVDDSFIVNSVILDGEASTILAGDWDGVLWAVAADTGEIRWHTKFGRERVRSVQYDDERVYAAHDGTVYAIARGTSEQAWEWHPDGPEKVGFVDIALADDALFAIVRNGLSTENRPWLFVLNPETGDELWHGGPLETMWTTAIVGDYLLVGLGSRLYVVDGDRQLPADAI